MNGHVAYAEGYVDFTMHDDVSQTVRYCQRRCLASQGWMRQTHPMAAKCNSIADQSWLVAIRSIAIACTNVTKYALRRR